ncbi:CtpF protein [Tepidicaulis sp.]|jgi:pilus assembly protein CpaE|uniref:CtpF protein n=1 Tax=Tepidicaulis sp. TaxID=1920809 RepID=UPI003B5AB48B
MTEAMPVYDDFEDEGPSLVLKPVPRITIEAFCEMPETGSMIQRGAEDRRLAKAHLTVHMGGVPAAIAYFRDTATPNLILVETHQSGEELFGELMQLAEVCDAGTKVIIIGHVNDVALYREMIRQGVNDYLVAPFSPLQLIESVSRLYIDPDAPPIGRSVAFIGARGGAGSSTLAHNVGWCIAEAMREDTTIIDFDLPFGTAGLDFNQDPVQGIADALVQPDRLDDVMLDRLMVKYTNRLSLFTAPGTLDRDGDLDPDACESIIEIVRQTCPVVVVDLPHIWAPWTKRVLLGADDVVISTTPDLAGLRNTKNIVDLLKQTRTNDTLPHVVLNQVGVSKRPEIPVKDFAEAIEVEPTLVLPFNPQLFGTAANNGQMLDEVDPKSKTVLGLKHLASVVIGRKEVQQRSKSILPFLSRLTGKKEG